MSKFDKDDDDLVIIYIKVYIKNNIKYIYNIIIYIYYRNIINREKYYLIVTLISIESLLFIELN